MKSARAWVWPLAALVLVVAWAAGRRFWSPGDTNGFGRIAFSWPFDVMPFLTFGAVPTAFAALLLCARRGAWRWLGIAVLVATTLGMALLAFSGSFGGICFEPGEDTCVVTQPAHLAHLLTPLVIVVFGWAVTQWRQRRSPVDQ